MVVGIRDAAKMVGIFIMSFCAVFVCTLFLNYNLDLAAIEDQIPAGPVMEYFDAQVMTGKVVSCVSGGCLLITSVIMLSFYIKHYIDTHRKELGILKALGYSNWKIASRFWVFGLTVFAGTLLGFASSFLLMPRFYEVQNETGILPEFHVHFHVTLAIWLVVLPSVVFALLSCLYSHHKLKCPALELMRGKAEKPAKRKKRSSEKEIAFLKEVKKSTVNSRKSLVFFIAFGAFCYSSMLQMSCSMNDLSSEMFGIMTFIIGVVLAFMSLFLAVTTVVKSNTKTIALMRVTGYSLKDCSHAILNGYRPWAYIGFVIGTMYQYGLLKMMVGIVFRDIENIPDYEFDFQAFVIALVSFIFLYELLMYAYSVKIKKVSVKEVMLEN